MINLINCVGDILDTSCDVIAHQVNCMGVMGSGVALAIKNKYPEVYPDYHSLCKSIEPERLLGNLHISATKDGKYIANCFGQLNYGWGKQHTDYRALEYSFNSLKNWMLATGKSRVAIPYKIGCVRGGGDWNTVFNIIYRVFCNNDIIVELWQLK